MLIDAVPQALRQGALHYLTLLHTWESRRADPTRTVDDCRRFDAALATVNRDVVDVCLAFDFVSTRFAGTDIPAGIGCQVADGVYRWTTRPHTILTDKGRWALKESRHAEPQPAAEPTDLVAMRVAIQKYEVSRPALKRAVGDKKIKSYRRDGAPRNAEHRFSEAELDKHYTRRPSR